MILSVWLLISIFGSMVIAFPQETNVPYDICRSGFDYNIEGIEDNIEYVENKTKSLSLSIADFAQKMYLHIASTTNNENFVFSPLSLHSALNLLYLGTTYNSTTRREMAKALGLLTNTPFLQGLYKNVINSYESQESFLYGNNIWIQEDFSVNTCYKESAKDLGAGVDNISFSSPDSADIINEWVQKMTNDKIKQLVESFSSNTKLFIANALYFNEQWLEPFDDKNDFGQNLETYFKTSRGSQRLTQFITQTSEDLIYGDILYGNNAMEVITVPYKNQDFEMKIILPNDIKGLQLLEKGLQLQEERDLPNSEKEYFNIFLQSNNITEEVFSEIQLTMPTFQVETKINAVEALKKLGAERVFTPEAEMDNLSSSGPLGVSSIIHRAVIEVNKDGTEGAAATGIEIVLFSGVDDKKYIVVDRPFIFIVQLKFAIS